MMRGYVYATLLICSAQVFACGIDPLVCAHHPVFAGLLARGKDICDGEADRVWDEELVQIFALYKTLCYCNLQNVECSRLSDRPCFFENVTGSHPDADADGRLYALQELARNYEQTITTAMPYAVVYREKNPGQIPAILHRWAYAGHHTLQLLNGRLSAYIESKNKGRPTGDQTTVRIVKYALKQYAEFLAVPQGEQSGKFCKLLDEACFPIMLFYSACRSAEASYYLKPYAQCTFLCNSSTTFKSVCGFVLGSGIRLTAHAWHEAYHRVFPVAAGVVVGGVVLHRIKPEIFTIGQRECRQQGIQADVIDKVVRRIVLKYSVSFAAVLAVLVGCYWFAFTDGSLSRRS